MANRRSGRGPHKVGDRPAGLRHKLGERLEVEIDDKIKLVVCKEAGHVVAYLKSPPERTRIVSF